MAIRKLLYSVNVFEIYILVAVRKLMLVSYLRLFGVSLLSSFYYLSSSILSTIYLYFPAFLQLRSLVFDSF